MKYFLAVASVVFLASSSRAELILHWSPTEKVAVGTPIVADLVLEETETTYLRDFGVSGASYIVTLTGAGSLDIPIENHEFDDSIQPTSNGTIATVVQTSILGVTSDTLSIHLGTFTINPTSVGTGSLEISLLNPDFPGDFTVYQNGSFDQIILDHTTTILQAPTFQFEIRPIPEPSSWLSLAIVLTSGIMYRCQRSDFR